jgi:hypothetical protein
MIRIVLALALALAISPAVAQPKKAAVPPRQASIITIIQNWADQDVQAAIALATSVDGLPDPVGAACWKTWAGASGVLKAHPLPLTLKLATDVEAARLVAMAIKKVCMDPNCSQVWNDILNQVTALAIVPLPVQLASVCSRIP